jgi:hypothetical protein
MPLYYFHLSFGSRTLSDEEGVDLPNRAAARQEALAVARDLAARKDPKGLAGWSLQVADHEESFLRLPIDGGPALEVVRSSHAGAAKAEPERAEPIVADAVAETKSAPAELARQVLAQLQRTTELVQRTERLREELLSETRKSEQNLADARRLLSYAWRV